MSTYLLTWNPLRSLWHDLKDNIRKGFYRDRWSVGVTKRIQPDDRVFLLKQGREEPHGIMASGWAKSECYKDKHWRVKGKTALYIDVHFDVILDPKKQIFPRSALKRGIYSQMHWDAQASGVVIPEDIASQLERDWAKLINLPMPFKKPVFADDVDSGKTCPEGAKKQITVNVYERSSEARSICINRYGATCSVCSFDFEKHFGEIGRGYIHVHHLKSLAEVGKNYELKPLTDLCPVCPNCHAMLHQRKPAYSIAELKSVMKKAAK